MKTNAYFYLKPPIIMTFNFPKALRVPLLALLTTTGLLMTSCKKEEEQIDNKDYTAIDEDIIKKYLTDSKITTAQRQPSGLYFVPVTTNPSGTPAVAEKTVSVLYTGYLMNGSVFDASSQRGNVPFTFVLGRRKVIDGWDQGIALMRKGDKALLLIPSALGYGSNSASSIPPNSVTRFEVELVDVK